MSLESMSQWMDAHFWATGHSQWHHSGAQWSYRECHRTGSDERSDLQCQCGGKEQHWRQQDIHWQFPCTL